MSSRFAPPSRGLVTSPADRHAARPRRVLWILNHTTLMEWEVPMLLAEGFEVFVPKVLPVGPNGRTATVTDVHDASLTIPAADLALLNTVNFYDQPLSGRTAATINRHFDVAIAASVFPGLHYLLRCFRGRIFMRAFGHAGDFDYESATATIPSGTYMGVNCGLYRVEITGQGNDGKPLPAKYNAASTLGAAVGGRLPENGVATFVLE